AHIEDMYAKSITKAFQKHLVTDTHALGTFNAAWERLSAETVEIATLHGQFSLRIANEIEKPLRDFARTHSEWQNLTLAEANCNRIAKEFDEKTTKVTKYTRAVERTTGKKSGAAEQKLMDYTKQLESLRTAWRLEGPVVLQKYQDVDQSRLEHLKQVVLAFEAIQSEIALQVDQISTQCISLAAEFDSLTDIEVFAAETSTDLHSLQPYDGASIMSTASHPNNGDRSLDDRRSNGVHKRGPTGSSQISAVSYSTDRSFSQSKAGSLDQTRSMDPQEHVRSGSSVPGSLLDTVSTPTIDAEGYSIPPPDNGHWTDGAGSMNFEDERSETSSFSQQPRMHLEIREDSVAESTDEARAALERVSSTLKLSKTIVRRHPGRRDYSLPVPALVAPGSSPSNAAGGGEAILEQGGVFAAEPESMDTSTLASPVEATPASPTMEIPAAVETVLNGNHGEAPAVSVEPRKQKWVVSVVEKVHALTQAGEVGKLMVTGEVVFLREEVTKEAEMEGASENETRRKAILRLARIQSLEKYLPNPAYLSQYVEKDGGVGTYWVDLEAIGRDLGQEPTGVTVLKYQVRSSEEGARQMLPLLIHPAWKCEAHQTSLLINYKANAQCRLLKGGEEEEGSEAQFQDLSFLVPVSGEVTGVQSKPTGVWGGETNKMFWDVESIAVDSTEPRKLLARFELNPASGPSQPSATAVKFR
ncbi:hypothetical protein BGW38_002476, partial [Lunasporangiospora selenospora]